MFTILFLSFLLVPRATRTLRFPANPIRPRDAWDTVVNRSWSGNAKPDAPDDWFPDAELLSIFSVWLIIRTSVILSQLSSVTFWVKNQRRKVDSSWFDNCAQICAARCGFCWLDPQKQLLFCFFIRGSRVLVKLELDPGKPKLCSWRFQILISRSQTSLLKWDRPPESQKGVARPKITPSTATTILIPFSLFWSLVAKQQEKANTQAVPMMKADAARAFVGKLCSGMG